MHPNVRRAADSPGGLSTQSGRAGASHPVARQLHPWPGDDAIATQAGLLLAVPWLTVDFIAVVDGLHADVRAAFWERMVPMRSDAAARPLVAQRLIEHGRAWAALSLLVMMLPGNATNRPALDVNLVESALLAAATGPSVDAHHAGSLSWEVGELLDHLERSDSDLRTRARLEFLFTNLLQHTRPARALYEALAADPALFAEILSYVYYAEDEAREQEVPPDRRTVAEVGFAVVRSWHTPPGVRPDGTVDGDALRAWVTEARRLLAESGRPVPGNISIGDVLSYVPADSDGLWPPETVRDLIEDFQSEHFEAGLRTGKINSRGPSPGPRPAAVSRSTTSPHSSEAGPSASPTAGTGPRLSCIRSQTTTTSGRDGRMIDPRTSGTRVPDLIPAVGGHAPSAARGDQAITAAIYGLVRSHPEDRGPDRPVLRDQRCGSRRLNAAVSTQCGLSDR
jgi:hypothetical protein